MEGQIDVQRAPGSRPEPASEGPRELSTPLRLLFLAGAVLALGAAFMTYVLTERTGDYFAWPIAPPLTAASLGGAYLAAVALLASSCRARTWAEGRIAVPSVMTISVLLLAATLIHWSRFEHGHVVFWLWLAAYVLVPPVLALLIRAQALAPGSDPEGRAPMPRWVRAGLLVHTVLLLGFGGLMFAFPGTAAAIWPWALTPLTSQALGAFTFGFGAAAAFVLWDNELTHVRGAAFAYAMLGAAQLIAVARYSGDVDLGQPGAWIYITFMATVLVGGIALLWLAMRPASADR